MPVARRFSFKLWSLSLIPRTVRLDIYNEKPGSAPSSTGILYGKSAWNFKFGANKEDFTQGNFQMHSFVPKRSNSLMKILHSELSSKPCWHAMWMKNLQIRKRYALVFTHPWKLHIVIPLCKFCIMWMPNISQCWAIKCSLPLIERLPERHAVRIICICLYLFLSFLNIKFYNSIQKLF